MGEQPPCSEQGEGERDGMLDKDDQILKHIHGNKAGQPLTEDRRGHQSTEKKELTPVVIPHLSTYIHFQVHVAIYEKRVQRYNKKMTSANKKSQKICVYAIYFVNLHRKLKK
jgi:hypothetical protein